MEDKMSHYAGQISDNNKFTGFSQKIVIKKDVPNPIRLVDTPNGVERYYIAWCCCDDDTRRPFILENEHQGKSILLKILGDRTKFYKGGILESVKDEITNKGRYLWESKHPELLMRIGYNNDPSGGSGSFKPREEYVFNGIQRNPDIDETTGTVSFWCKENKHTKLYIINSLAFQQLQDLRINDGNPSEYDINHLKKGERLNTTHNILKAGMVVPNVIIGPLSPEEQTYTRYDLKVESALVTPTETLQYLRNTITQIDEIMGSNWISILEQEATKDVVTQPQASIQTSSVSIPNQTVVAPTIANTIQSPQQTVSQPVVDMNASKVPTRLAAPQRKVEVNQVLCKYCETMVPENSEVCPNCHNKLLEPCANPNCGKLFSVFDSVCPYCGKTYTISM